MIDFYVLNHADRQEAKLFVCRLIEECYEQGQHIFLATASLEESAAWDDWLWRYRNDSFLPHMTTDHALYSPILIGQMNTTIPPDVLVNLCAAVPADYTNYKRVIEIVYNDPDVQKYARLRYKQYRDAGMTINTHKI